MLVMLGLPSCGGAGSDSEGDEAASSDTASSVTVDNPAAAETETEQHQTETKTENDDLETMAPGFELVEWGGAGPVLDHLDNGGGDPPLLDLFISGPEGVDRLDLGAGTWSSFDVEGGPALVSGEWLLLARGLGDFAAVSLTTGALHREWPEWTGWIVPRQDHLAPPGLVWIRAGDDALVWQLLDIETGEILRSVGTDRSVVNVGDPVVAGATTGHVFRLGADGYLPISDARLLATSEPFALVRSCATPRSCQTGWIDAVTGDPVDRPFPPELDAPAFHLSTNGRLVLGIGGAHYEETGDQLHWLHDVDRDQTIHLPSSLFGPGDMAYGSVSMSADGRVVAVAGIRYVDLYLMDEGRVVRIATDVRNPDVFLSPPPEVRATSAPAAAEVLGASITARASYPDPADEPEIDPGNAFRLGPGDQPWLGRETGLSLVLGDLNFFQVVDLDAGVVTEHDSVGPIMGGGRGQVITQKGGLHVVALDEPEQAIQVGSEPVYLDIVYPASRSAATPGQLWVKAIAGGDSTDLEWQLYDLATARLVEARPWRWWHDFQPLTGFDDPIQTSDAGGVFTWDGEHYEKVFDGGLKAVGGGDHVLAETCAGPGACRSIWLDTRTWQEVERNLPASVLDGPAELSADGRLLSFSSARRHWWTIYDVESGFMVRRIEHYLHVRESISPNGRYVTLTFRGYVPNVTVFDVETRDVYVLPVELRAGESMPVFVDSP